MGCANKGTQIPVHLQAFPSACFQPLQLVEHLSTSKVCAAEFGAERWLGMLLLICCRTTGSMRASTNWKQNSSKRRKSQAELGCVGKGNGTTGQGCSQHPGGSSRYPAEGLPEPTPAAGLPGSQLGELHFSAILTALKRHSWVFQRTISSQRQKTTCSNVPKHKPRCRP